mmetsp:Transcript_12738/g.16099  ORF Transcript_12738/g.16099 Transcript_12738/m.16099 type:complete len:88 (-) Transcript_12738:59-322(-)
MIGLPSRRIQNYSRRFFSSLFCVVCRFLFVFVFVLCVAFVEFVRFVFGLMKFYPVRLFVQKIVIFIVQLTNTLFSCTEITRLNAATV